MAKTAKTPRKYVLLDEEFAYLLQLWNTPQTQTELKNLPIKEPDDDGLFKPGVAAGSGSDKEVTRLVHIASRVFTELNKKYPPTQIMESETEEQAAARKEGLRVPYNIKPRLRVAETEEEFAKRDKGRWTYVHGWCRRNSPYCNTNKGAKGAKIDSFVARTTPAVKLTAFHL
ncbi:hypothetical protein EIP86_006305, partial [Pleurotus ostreatoroseus]